MLCRPWCQAAMSSGNVVPVKNSSSCTSKVTRRVFVQTDNHRFISSLEAVVLAVSVQNDQFAFELAIQTKLDADCITSSRRCQIHVPVFVHKQNTEHQAEDIRKIELQTVMKTIVRIYQCHYCKEKWCCSLKSAKIIRHWKARYAESYNNMQ